MSSVRILAGTRKGAFIVRLDGGKSWLELAVVEGREAFLIVGAIYDG